MDRRTFLAGTGAVLLTAPLAAGVSAQPPRPVPRVGILNSGAAQDARVDYFRDELRKLGYR